MYINSSDYRFAEVVHGIYHPFGSCASCFSLTPICLPRGFFNIDLTGTGIGVSPTVHWDKSGSPSRALDLYKLHRGVYGELVDGNCGARCGECSPNGKLFVDLIVSYEEKSWKYFGEQNASLMETTDKDWNDRRFGLSDGSSPL